MIKSKYASVFVAFPLLGLVHAAQIEAAERQVAIAAPIVGTETAEPLGFLDYVADGAMKVIRGRVSPKTPLGAMALDFAEKIYKVVRNEQEIARYRAEGRKMLLDLAELSERTGETEAEFRRRIGALEDDWKRITGVVEEVKKTAEEALKSAATATVKAEAAQAEAARAAAAAKKQREDADRQRDKDQAAIKKAIEDEVVRRLAASRPAPTPRPATQPVVAPMPVNDDEPFTKKLQGWEHITPYKHKTKS